MSERRVIVWSGEDPNSGCAQYRMRFPARALIAQGADVELSEDFHGPKIYWDRKWQGRFPPPDVRAVGLAATPEADTVVIQRPGRRWWSEIIPMLQERGIRVVVDVDDLLDDIHQQNTAKNQFDPRYKPDMNFEWIDLACQRADVVTCTTEALKAHYGYGHGWVLPNLVPERYLSVKAMRRPHTVGWTGTTDVHPNDLQVTRGDVGAVLKDTHWTFHHVGTGVRIQQALGLPEPPTFSGWVPFDEYPEQMAQIEVGIVPLENTAFNRAKSCLKMIEFASLGIPVLASPTPDNVRMQKLGVGVTVKDTQWYRRLHKVVTDSDYREELAETGREVMKSHTYEQKASMWWDVWTGKMSGT